MGQQKNIGGGVKIKFIIIIDAHLSVLISPGHGLFVEFAARRVLLVVILQLLLLLLLLLHHVHLYSVRRSELGGDGTHVGEKTYINSWQKKKNVERNSARR